MAKPTMARRRLQYCALVSLCLLPRSTVSFTTFARLSAPRMSAFPSRASSPRVQRTSLSLSTTPSNDDRSQSTPQQEQPLADSTAPSIIRKYLGKAVEAIVRPGCVLVAPKNEFHHFYRQAAIFIFTMGVDENDYYVIRGVILDHPTPFTVTEMTTNKELPKEMGDSLLFRGGDKGGDGLLLLQQGGAGGGEPAGDSSGICHGGWETAIQACQQQRESTEGEDQFKAFFNYCEFTEKELEKMLDQEDEEGMGDGWISVEVDPQVVLNGDYDRGDCWKLLRNAVRQIEQEETEEAGFQ